MDKSFYRLHEDFINKAEVLRFLGYKGADADDNTKRLIDECAEELKSIADPRKIYRVFPAEACRDILQGEDIKKHVEGCSKIILLAATLGAKVDKAISMYEMKSMSKALVMDACASSLIEKTCDDAEQEMNDALDGMFMTWRFSPGYGDFPIDMQRKLIDILDAEKRIGLTVSDSFIMIPRKSVTAVIGLSDEKIEKKRLGCLACNMYDRCTLRREGGHCGF